MTIHLCNLYYCNCPAKIRSRPTLTLKDQMGVSNTLERWSRGFLGVCFVVFVEEVVMVLWYGLYCMTFTGLLGFLLYNMMPEGNSV